MFDRDFFKFLFGFAIIIAVSLMAVIVLRSYQGQSQNSVAQAFKSFFIK